MRLTLFILIFVFQTSCTSRDEAAIILKSANLEPIAGCEIEVCEDIAAIDCGAEVDGPLFYINTKKNKLVMCCGGCCDTDERQGTQCSQCPPKSWGC